MNGPLHAERTAEDTGAGRAPLRVRIPADLETPVSAFLKLKPRGASFLLESVERGIQVGRYSFIGMAPETSIRLADGTVTIARHGDDGAVTGRVTEPLDPAAPFAALRTELARAPLAGTDDLPAPFGGAVGYVGYDLVRRFERIPLPADPGLGLPDCHLLLPRTLAVFDHVKCEIELVTRPPAGDPELARAEAVREIDTLLEALHAPLPPTGGGDGGGASNVARARSASVAAGASTRGTGTPAAPDLESNLSREAFEAKVRAAKEHILAGDAFQIVLSQRLRGETGVAPFQIYRALRILNPSPYMFFLDCGDLQLVGSSPEMLVKLERGRLTLNPIAGTRPRGGTPAEDRELERELVADEKERAEHVMLVDLGRNDLGRVCEIGSVRVDDLMTVERYSHVMHLVSRVSGRLRGDLDMFDALRASFPAGTVTGAPKIRAMQIISELEEDRRGPYAGAVGYFGQRGDMDMCIAIRTLLVREREYFAQAGAGIVADSDPAREYEETLSKIRALTRAVQIAEEGL
jgi:anthranilate synthase component 1